MTYSEELFYGIGVYISIILILGAFLNIAVIAVFIKLERRHTNTLNALIISISISNSLQSFVAYPLNATSAFHTKWIFGEWPCTLDAFWVHWMALTSINHLAVFSLER